MENKQQRILLRWVSAILLGLLGLGLVTPVQARKSDVTDPVPTLAYYYIWFDTTSWNRAKIDYPQLGRYSSDDRAVMRQHIEWAKAAGIKGFIVSWKSTDVLNRRLEQLIALSEEEDFKLVIIYQGLDFNRNPQPVDRIASDLDLFIKRYASSKVFNLYPKPVVIISGTWKYSPAEISEITRDRRQSLLILASEKNEDGYNRLANLVDGDAYYWSSVNPDTFTKHQEKLAAMGEAVHKNGGLWIPSAAPGFDARMIGGTSVVDRKDGETLRTQVNTAMASSPDMLGIISWNEFSENSYIEPSVKYGAKYLNVLSEINHMPSPAIGEFDSSEPPAKNIPGVPYARQAALGAIAVLIVTGLIVIAVRRT